MDNLILGTDSYKLSQHEMYSDDTEAVYSYFEARTGAQFEETVFFGLQALIKEHLTGKRITSWDILEAKQFVDGNMGPGIYNEAGWQEIADRFNGRLPLRIWAVPEGSVHAPSTVLMAVENTGGPSTAWLTDYIETLLVQVWYPMTVASLSRAIKQDIAEQLYITTGSTDGIEFMLQDFGCRGATGMEAAAIGGMAHLVNFKGTDTVPALFAAKNYYGGDPAELGYSIPAAQHSIMTAHGPEGESGVVGMLLERFPSGLLAAPIDSYNYVNYIDNIVGKDHYETIMNRDGKFVCRPDSTSSIHPTPEEEMVWILDRLYAIFGGTINAQGYKVLDPHIGALWGDGIDRAGIRKIMNATEDAGFALNNYVFGMGGALLQKVNRDTQRCAFKCSAMKRDGVWYDVQKSPLDQSKASKTGRFDGLELVFENGEIVKEYTFDEVRENAAI